MLHKIPTGSALSLLPTQHSTLHSQSSQCCIVLRDKVLHICTCLCRTPLGVFRRISLWGFLSGACQTRWPILIVAGCFDPIYLHTCLLLYVWRQPPPAPCLSYLQRKNLRFESWFALINFLFTDSMGMGFQWAFLFVVQVRVRASTHTHTHTSMQGYETLSIQHICVTHLRYLCASMCAWVCVCAASGALTGNISVATFL